MRFSARWRAWAAHHRVHVGIVFALVYVAFSMPSPRTFWLGAAIVVLGESIRVWACGHLVRNEELTREGPYRHVRHPLYVGSFLIGIGLALLAEHQLLWLGAFAALYLGFYLPAIYVEELRLQSLFGAEYLEYMDEVPRFVPIPGRSHAWDQEQGPAARFSRDKSRRNREMRTVAVMALLLVVQYLKGLIPL
jgi:protein-S-isoprenylcysteine O-methyltransferase Ste14